MELVVHDFGIMWNSLDNALSSIVFYFGIKVAVEEGVHDIRPQFTPQFILIIIAIAPNFYRFLAIIIFKSITLRYSSILSSRNSKII